MSYRTPTKSPYSKRRKEADFSVDWFQHFFKDFLRPYGRSLIPEELTDEALEHRTQTFTCEWLTRPSVAVSEFAETILRNKDLTPALNDITDARAFQEYQSHVQDVITQVQPLWTSPANPLGQVTLTRDDIVRRFQRLEQLMEHQHSSFLDRYLDVMVEAGNALYVTAMHLKMLSFLMRNKGKWSSKFRSAPDHEQFKKNPEISVYADLVFQGYIARKGQSVLPLESTARRRISEFMSDSQPVSNNGLGGVSPPLPSSSVAQTSLIARLQEEHLSSRNVAQNSLSHCNNDVITDIASRSSHDGHGLVKQNTDRNFTGLSAQQSMSASHLQIPVSSAIASSSVSALNQQAQIGPTQNGTGVSDRFSNMSGLNVSNLRPTVNGETDIACGRSQSHLYVPHSDKLAPTLSNFHQDPASTSYDQQNLSSSNTGEPAVHGPLQNGTSGSCDFIQQNVSSKLTKRKKKSSESKNIKKVKHTVDFPEMSTTSLDSVDVVRSAEWSDQIQPLEASTTSTKKKKKKSKKNNDHRG